jgi:hypothetical protein
MILMPKLRLKKRSDSGQIGDSSALTPERRRGAARRYRAKMAGRVGVVGVSDNGVQGESGRRVGVTPLTRRHPNRHGDVRSHVEGYKNPLSAKLTVSPPAMMM